MPGTKYAGTGFPNGFRPDAKKPFDVRLVVDTTVDRNHVQFTYPGMEVTVLGAPLTVSGKVTYPSATVYKLLAERDSVFSGGPTSFDQDWKLLSNSAESGAGYRGPLNLNTGSTPGSIELSPNLNDAALRATLKAGDYYKVAFIAATAVDAGSTVGGTSDAPQASYNIDGITQLAVNDTVFWNGTRFDRFQNTNPLPVNPLYLDTESERFLGDVLRLIRLNAFKEWTAAQPYLRNAYVKSSYTVDGRNYVDTWQATADMNAANAGLPTDATPNPNWQLVTTTNGVKLGGTARQDDTVGRAATGAFAPTTRTPGVYLSPEESDARQKQYAGQFARPILGGNAQTFLTADANETPRN